MLWPTFSVVRTTALRLAASTQLCLQLGLLCHPMAWCLFLGTDTLWATQKITQRLVPSGDNVQTLTCAAPFDISLREYVLCFVVTIRGPPVHCPGICLPCPFLTLPPLDFQICPFFPFFAPSISNQGVGRPPPWDFALFCFLAPFSFRNLPPLSPAPLFSRGRCQGGQPPACLAERRE